MNLAMAGQTLRDQLAALPDTTRWADFRSGHLPKGAEPYSFSHRCCKACAVVPPHVVGYTVTAFASWLYALNPRHRHNRRSLEMGKEVERAVSDAQHARARAARIRSEPPPPTRWKLEHKDTLDGKARRFPASALRVCGRVIHGIPDLVYRHTKTKEVVIVERKATGWSVPSDGWPNLRAQLWAYSQLDEWADAPKITLVGEVWNDTPLRPKRKATLRWTTDDKEFMAQSAELFAIYADHCARISAK